MIEWTIDEVRRLLAPMREAYRRGDNAMAKAREELAQDQNHILSTLIAYDLQAGSYTEEALRKPRELAEWCDQIAGNIAPFAADCMSVLEVGCGEANTLRGVIERLDKPELQIFGFDISWSRLLYARRWLNGGPFAVNLFAADLFNIPLADSSVDIVYTSHSIEPNGGRELQALQELTRVARKAVILVEPIFELGSEAAQRRMASHGFVRGLTAAAEKVGKVTKSELLPYSPRTSNPSGVIVIELNKPAGGREHQWQCPVSGHALRNLGDAFFAAEAGLAYPVLRDIPMLLPHYAIIASHFDKSSAETSG